MDHFENFPHSLLVKYLGMHSVQINRLRKPVSFSNFVSTGTWISATQDLHCVYLLNIRSNSD